MDKSAIEHIQALAAQALVAEAFKSALASNSAAVALPNAFQVVDLENYYVERQAPRGMARVDTFESFFKLADKSAPVWVNKKEMKATNFIDFGSAFGVGHGRNIVLLCLTECPAWKMIKEFALPKLIPQQKMAELFEDWSPYFCSDDHKSGTLIGRAVRKATIKAVTTADHNVGNLSASTSVFEKIEAESGDGELPTVIEFTLVPYLGLKQRSVTLRLGVVKNTAKCDFVLQVINYESLVEEIATEFAEKLSYLGQFPAVHLGTYTPNPQAT